MGVFRGKQEVLAQKLRDCILATLGVPVFESYKILGAQCDFSCIPHS